MNSINKKTHYQNLKVTSNAKQYVIDAAYHALLQDIELSKRDAEIIEKIKKILNASYAVLSDPAQRAIYDKSLTLVESDIHTTKPVVQVEPEKISIAIEKPELVIQPKPETISVKKEFVTSSPTPEEKKNTPKFNHIKTIIIVSSLIGVGIAGFIGYKFYPQTAQEDVKSSDLQKEKVEQIPAVEGTKENVEKIVTDEPKQVETKTNAENSIQEKKSYDAVVQTEKQADIERLNARKSRRDELLAKQENIVFDDFEQVAESRKKIMQAEAANIAVMQQSLQDYDLKIQEKIRANSIAEQEDAEAFAKAESTREVEIKKIAVEQNEIDRLLVENEKHSKELAQQLIDLTEKGNVLSRQAELKQLHDKAISGIKQKINDTWSDMASDIDSSLSGLDPQTSSKFKCTIDVKLDSSGKVLDAVITKNSGYAGFDNAAQNAVNHSSPFPVPNNDEMFEKEFKSISFIFSRNAVVFK